MSLIQLKVEHGRTFEEARDRLALAVQEIQTRFGLMVRKVEWSPGRDSVTLEGPGVRIDLKVDALAVHVTGDIPMLAGILGSPRLKQIVESAFRKS
jgi:hypothetical protein